jgi:HK97 gp10 family phage protein
MITMQLVGVDALLKKIDKIGNEAKSKANAELVAFGNDVVGEAKNLCPADEGHLKGAIGYQPGNLEVTIVAATNYAAYMEFGTRKFAAAYVSTLPAQWQAFARQFKGRGTGTFKEFVESLMGWVHRKGLGTGYRGKIGVTGTYSVKTRKRVGSKTQQASEDRQAAYAIALYIMKNGVKPRPFLYPAIRNNLPKLQKRLKNIYKNG